MSSVEIFRNKSGETQIEVTFDRETVWLNLNQMAKLFGRDKSVISRHLKKIFKEEELDYHSTVAKNATVQKEGSKEVIRKVDYYNLDAIISVGYRVNSREGTHFRIWATQKLKEYLVQGYSINQKRLDELQKVVEIIQHSSDNSIQQSQGLLEILSSYTKSFILLNQFDSNSIQAEHLAENIIYEIEYDEAKTAISTLKKELILKKEASELFGNEKDDTFSGILRSICQSFGGQFLYPSIEEQASHLLYFIIKNHPFSDGNKRIGAFIFIWFLEKNKHLLKKSGEKKINDNALIAVALLVAQSHPDDKELLIKLICNLINDQ